MAATVKANAVMGANKASVGVPSEFRQTLLSALYKLGDRDTQQQAAAELEAICSSITGDTLPAVMSCLFDTDDRWACARTAINRLPC